MRYTPLLCTSLFCSLLMGASPIFAGLSSDEEERFLAPQAVAQTVPLTRSDRPLEEAQTLSPYQKASIGLLMYSDNYEQTDYHLLHVIALLEKNPTKTEIKRLQKVWTYVDAAMRNKKLARIPAILRASRKKQ